MSKEKSFREVFIRMVDKKTGRMIEASKPLPSNADWHYDTGGIRYIR